MRSGLRRFTPGFTGRALLGKSLREGRTCRLRDYHPLWPNFPGRSARCFLCDSPGPTCRTDSNSHDPGACNAQVLVHTPGLGWSVFARRYLRSRNFLSFLVVLRCITSHRCLFTPMYSAQSIPRLREGFPIQRSPDQGLVGGSPGLIAASHVFHRLLAPRHPPCTLSSLTSIVLRSRETYWKPVALERHGFLVFGLSMKPSLSKTPISRPRQPGTKSLECPRGHSYRFSTIHFSKSTDFYTKNKVQTEGSFL